MYGYVSGEVLAIELAKSRALILVSGLGLGLYVTVYFDDGKDSLKVGTNVNLYIFHQKSEYAENLYGFPDFTSKSIFEALHNSSKGVATKSIYTLIHKYKISSKESLGKLTLEDIKQVKGVGLAGAKKILVSISNLLSNSIEIFDLEDNFSRIQNKFKPELKLLKEMGIPLEKIKEIFNSSEYTLLIKMQSKEIVEYIIKNYKKN